MTDDNVTNCLSTGGSSRCLVMKGGIRTGLLPVGVQCALGGVFNGILISDAFQNDV